MYSIICLPKIINTLINFNSKFIFKKCLNNVTINNLSAVVSNVNRRIWVSNTTPTSGQGNIGDIWYQY